MWNRHVETFLGCDSEYAAADIVLLGAAFDATTSYRPGTRFASRVMRAESYGLETYSPYLDRDLSELAVFDAGDPELPFGEPAHALALLEEKIKTILADEKLPVMLGGEHLVTLAAVRAVTARYPDLHIIHLDAHADLRDDYLGAKLSHACVLRRCWDLLGDGRIFQFGIRSGDQSEFIWGAQHVWTHRFDLDGLQEKLEQLCGMPLYFTLDLDVLDPSVFPGTGTPEPGGISFQELLAGVHALRGHRIVGCDICELSPPYDPSGISTAAADKILRELLLTIG